MITFTDDQIGQLSCEEKALFDGFVAKVNAQVTSDEEAFDVKAFLLKREAQMKADAQAERELEENFV